MLHWIYSITVFYNTLKHNRIILYHIWYLLHENQQYYIYIPEYSQYWFQHAALNLITKSSEFTLLQYSTTLSSIITSSCVIFNICYMMNQQYYIYSRTPQVLFQHAALNLITTKWEFTLLQYSTTLLSIIASFCIIFDICYMMNQQCYIYSRIPPVLISTCCIEFTLLLYCTTLSSIIASFCIIFDICYMMNQQCYIYSRIPPVLISTCCIEFTLLLYSTTLSSIIASFCIIFDICNMMNQQCYINSRILPVLISACRDKFSHYKTWIYSITIFYNTLKHNRIILYHIWYLQHDEPTVLYKFQNSPSIDFSMPW